MELQVSKLERKRFIICYLSFYSSIVWYITSFRFIFVIVWAAKIGFFGEKLTLKAKSMQMIQVR